MLALRLAVEGLRGYDDELAHVCGCLRDQLFFTDAAQSLADEAVLASGGTPGGVSSKAVVALDGGQSAASAVTAVLRAQLAIIEANRAGALADTDTEFLHDLRVAVRRTRAVQREAKDVFAPEGLAHFRAEFRWLQQVTGDARDMDVYLLGFEELRALIAAPLRADLDPLLAVLHTRHRRAHAAMNRALRSDRATSLPDAWRAFLVALEAGDGGPAAVHDDRRGWSGGASAPSTGRWSAWALPSTPTPRPRSTTSCARRARSCATCSSCSGRRCIPRRWSSR